MAAASESGSPATTSPEYFAEARINSPKRESSLPRSRPSFPTNRLISGGQGGARVGGRSAGEGAKGHSPVTAHAPESSEHEARGHFSKAGAHFERLAECASPPAFI